MDQLKADLAPIRDACARKSVLRHTSRMARIIGCRQIAVLEPGDLDDIADAAGVSGINPGELRSFGNADMVARVVDRETGQEKYLAVEVARAANPDDVYRAIRNAEYLTRFTGLPAVAMVASIRVNPEVQPDIDSGRVVWYEVEARLMEPE